MKKNVPLFTFEIPLIRENDELKIIDLKMLGEAKDTIRRIKKKEKRKTIDDENGNEQDGEEDFLDEDQFSMIDDEFRGAEQYNSHMSRLGSVIRNIESRERKIRTSLLRKTGKEIAREEKESRRVAQELRQKNRYRKKKRKGKRKKKVDQNEYDLQDNFIDDENYEDFVRLSGSEDENDDQVDMEHWVEEEDDDNLDVSYPYSSASSKKKSSSTTPFEVPPSPLRMDKKKKRRRLDFGKGFEADLVDSLRILETKCDKLKEKNVKKQNFKWDDVYPELSQVAILRVKYFKKGIPKKLTNVILSFPVLCEFSEGTVKKNLRHLVFVHEVSELDKRIQQFTNQLRKCILQDYHVKLIKSNSGSAQGIPLPSQNGFLGTVRNKGIVFSWNQEADRLLFLIVENIKVVVEKSNSLKTKKRQKKSKRILEDEVREKFNEIIRVLPNQQNFDFNEKLKEIEEYYDANPEEKPKVEEVIKCAVPEKQQGGKKKGRPKKTASNPAPSMKKTEEEDIMFPPPPATPTIQTVSQPELRLSDSFEPSEDENSENSVHSMSLRVRPPKPMIGERSPNSAMKDGNIFFDEEEELSNEEDDELKTPENGRSKVLIPGDSEEREEKMEIVVSDDSEEDVEITGVKRPRDEDNKEVEEIKNLESAKKKMKFSKVE